MRAAGRLSPAFRVLRKAYPKSVCSVVVASATSLIVMRSCSATAEPSRVLPHRPAFSGASWQCVECLRLKFGTRCVGARQLCAIEAWRPRSIDKAKFTEQTGRSVLPARGHGCSLGYVGLPAQNTLDLT